MLYYTYKNYNYEVHMKNKQPPFRITNKIIDAVADISELTGRLSAHDHLSGNPNLRRTNRIRTIHGSLAIEQNTLSLEQVTAVLNGKPVLAPPKDMLRLAYGVCWQDKDKKHIQRKPYLQIM